jgi:hypothetical protein
MLASSALRKPICFVPHSPDAGALGGEQLELLQHDAEGALKNVHRCRHGAAAPPSPPPFAWCACAVKCVCSNIMVNWSSSGASRVL